jgi:excisionase family DNA binding protein
MMLAQMADYVSVREAAAILNYHPQRVREMVLEGKLDADKKSGAWWIYRESVEAYKEAVAGKSKHDPTRGKDL